jgi:hypothetical protein
MLTPVPEAREDPAAVLAEQAAASLSLEDEVRPHEAWDKGSPWRGSAEIHTYFRH